MARARVVATFADPSFWVCDTPPALPAGSPASSTDDLTKAQTACGGPKSTSGFAMMVTFKSDAAGGALPAGQDVIQQVQLAGIEYRTKRDCGDDPHPFAFNFTEYFKQPAQDLHFRVQCCESKYEVTVQLNTAIMALPAGLKANYPVPDKENASLFAKLADPSGEGNARDNVAKDCTLVWGYRYEYDGCHRTKPETSCKKAQCLEVWQQTRNPDETDPKKSALGEKQKVYPK